MENTQLLQFLKGKFLENPASGNPGPAVTISREYGCQGFELAEKLAQILSTRMDISGKRHDWHAIGREIIEEAAENFQLPVDLVDAISRSKPKGVLSEFLESLSPYQRPCDIEIKKMVARRFALDKISFEELIKIVGYKEARKIAFYVQTAKKSFVEGLR